MLTYLKRYASAIFGVFFVVAGLNHFINPSFYLPLIPDYLPFHRWINAAAGLAEIAAGSGMLYLQTRKAAAWLIVAMLIAFIPSHVYFIQIGSCVPDGLCVPPWVGWIRLLIIHPLLIAGAYYFTRQR